MPRLKFFKDTCLAPPALRSQVLKRPLTSQRSSLPGRIPERRLFRKRAPVALSTPARNESLSYSPATTSKQK
jgi:hypothetical protein